MNKIISLPKILSRFKMAASAMLLITAFELQAQTIYLDAENSIFFGATVTTNACGQSGTEYVTHFESETNLVRWNFAASNGLYRLVIRSRSSLGEKRFEAKLNGFGISGMFPKATNALSEFDAGLVQLQDGTNVLTMGGGWNYYDIDRVGLTPARPSPLLPVPARLADPQATPAAQGLMRDLVATYGKVTWSGQAEASELSNVSGVTGRNPIIVCGDLMNYSPSRIACGAKPGQLTESYIALKNQGHVISMCWHWNAPTNLLDTSDHRWWRGFYTDASTFDVAAALADTNSAGYHLLLRDMDAIAAQLKKFSRQNIPVLWRPLHEAEGRWFWWRAKGPEPFKKLWRLMFDRLAVHHGLHNLIWVLTNDDPAWYPGDDVVDILGLDAYPDDRSDPLSGRWEAFKSRFDGKKLVALTEFGGVPDIEKMHQFGVWFSYFAPWSGPFGPSSMSVETLRRIYNSREVLTLDEFNQTP